eukprot:TRINITY_DN1411_c0_g1_i1.p2 TRINITY_DN1411_c0_g1~~TRINITY_DN1411_c0_g1_i1.p2  ORF type:complete len:302 (-),score=88.65 TRINITY_DN1411_c0_g1_i1:42-947(-)
MESKVAEIIDGVSIAQQVRNEIKEKVVKLKEKFNTVPKLSVILVGARKDSETYVRMKERAAAEVGIEFQLVKFEEDAKEEVVIETINKLNTDESVSGIIVQLPLPQHMNEKKVAGSVIYTKDVDGFHVENMGALALKGWEPAFVACTPRGVMEMLKRSNISVEGKKAVVIGRSNIVGIPISLLLLNANATVSICHSRSQNIEEEVRSGDIVIAAVGRANFVKGSWIKPGAIVIDVGINPVEDKSLKSGYRLVGDVCFDEVKLVAGKITKVPGGVGPMTVATLLLSTLEGYEKALKNKGFDF